MDYSAPAKETISLVGKSTGMLEATLGGFVPQTARVGQMKLEAPLQYCGKRQPGARVWLTQMERYMQLMCYAPIDWLDVVTMRVEGIASSWVNVVLQDVVVGIGQYSPLEPSSRRQWCSNLSQPLRWKKRKSNCEH